MNDQRLLYCQQPFSMFPGEITTQLAHSDDMSNRVYQQLIWYKMTTDFVYRPHQISSIELKINDESTRLLIDGQKLALASRSNSGKKCTADSSIPNEIFQGSNNKHDLQASRTSLNWLILESRV